MPDLLTHYVFSYLIASRVCNWRKSLIVAFIGLLPDIDALFRIHRWFTGKPRKKAQTLQG